MTSGGLGEYVFVQVVVVVAHKEHTFWSHPTVRRRQMISISFGDSYVFVRLQKLSWELSRMKVKHLQRSMHGKLSDRQ